MSVRNEPVCSALAARAHPVRDARPVDTGDLGDFGWPSEGSDYRSSGFHIERVARIATSPQDPVANLITDARRDRRYGHPMLNEWVADALKHSGMGQAELSRRLTEKLRRAIDRAAVNKMVSGKRAVSGDEMLAIEEATGFPAPMENADGLTKVPLLDTLVSAGNLSPREAVRPEDVERYVVASDLPPGNWFALTVEGDSMDLVSPAGSVIFVNRADTRLVEGGFYVVSLESEAGTTYKRFREYPDYFSPYSTNRDHGPVLLDVPYRVIGRVYRTLLDIGPAAKASRK